MELAINETETPIIEVDSRISEAVIADKFLKYISIVLEGCLIIDSNIWMGEDYGDLFTVLRESCKKHNNLLKIHEKQILEIKYFEKKVNISSKINHSSRIGIHRIEKFRKENYLEIKKENISKNKYKYNLPIIIELILDQANKNTITTLITDDKNLRIESRKLNKFFRLGNFSLVDFDSLLKDCKFYVNNMQK